MQTVHVNVVHEERLTSYMKLVKQEYISQSSYAKMTCADTSQVVRVCTGRIAALEKDGMHHLLSQPSRKQLAVRCQVLCTCAAAVLLLLH